MKDMMNFIQVNRLLSLSPLVNQQAYIPINEVIAIVSCKEFKFSNNSLVGLLYFDIENKKEYWAWHSIKDINYDDICREFGFVKIEDIQYNFVYINPKQIKYIIDNKIIMMGHNIFFEYPYISFSYFCQFKTPLDEECLVNMNKVKAIQEEDYITIDPKLIKEYLIANNLGSTNKLFYIIFEDCSSITVVGDNIQQIGIGAIEL